MSEKETIFSSKIRYAGVFSFKDFYKFCYDWLTEETGLGITEEKYEETITGETKKIVVGWEGAREVTDYFKFELKIKFNIGGLQNVEIAQPGGAKVSTNKGSVQVDVKGNLVRDYEGKFEKSSFQKFLRSVYEKWVIPARIEEYETKLSGACDEFLSQAKAYLDLEGKR